MCVYLFTWFREEGAAYYPASVAKLCKIVQQQAAEAARIGRANEGIRGSLRYWSFHDCCTYMTITTLLDTECTAVDLSAFYIC